MPSISSQGQYSVPFDTHVVICVAAVESDSSFSGDQERMEKIVKTDNPSEAFQQLHRELSERLTKYEQDFKSATTSLDQFFEANFRCPNVVDILAGPYLRVYDALCVDSRKELDEKLQTLGLEGGDNEFRQCLENVETVEKAWDQLLLEIDSRMLANHITSRGFQSVMPDSIELIDCDTDKPITLKSCLDTKLEADKVSKSGSTPRYTLLVLLRFYG